MRKRTERTVLHRLQSPQPSSHPNPTVIVSFLVLKCSQMTWLWVFKSRYDLLEEVKSLEELSGEKPSKGPAVSFTLSAPIQSALASAFTLGLLPLNPLPGLQVCPSPGKRHPPLSPPCLQHAFLAS